MCSTLLLVALVAGTAHARVYVGLCLSTYLVAERPQRSVLRVVVRTPEVISGVVGERMDCLG